MKLFINLLALIASMFMHPAAANTLRGQNSHWQCASHDISGKQWLAESSFQRAAINKAWQSCKKNSHDPGSCETAKAYCEMVYLGRVIRSKWVCSSMDQMGHRWRSDTHNTRNDAVTGARMMCREQSTFPGSCYVRLMTCKNLNVARR